MMIPMMMNYVLVQYVGFGESKMLMLLGGAGAPPLRHPCNGSAAAFLNLRVPLPLGLTHASPASPFRSFKKHDFPAFTHSFSPFSSSGLRTPLSSHPSSPLPEALDDASRTQPQPQANNDTSLSQLVGTTSLPLLALYGGLTAGGLYLLDSILNSFEAFPLLPEIMQFIGVLYAILVAGQIFQGKQLSLTPSPVKSVIELIEKEGTTIQGADLELPQVLDKKILAIMTQLRRERDEAVSQVEVLKKRVIDYARIIAEKEALEAVAIQLAQERDQAMSEVAALKQAVDAMSDRMQAVESTLQQELEPLKLNSQALENVAFQLASERDMALKELSELKEELVLTKYKDTGKVSLNSLTSELTIEKDQSENKHSMEVLDDLQIPLTAEQEEFLRSHIDSTGLQFIDIQKPYEEQKEDVEKLVSYLVNEYGAPSGWTTDYLKQLLATESQSALRVSSASFEHDSENV